METVTTPNAPTSQSSTRQKPSSSAPLTSDLSNLSRSRERKLCQSSSSACPNPEGPGGKTSRPPSENSKAPKGGMASRMASQDGITSKTGSKVAAQNSLTKSQEQITALKSDLDAVRALITCKICDRLLYEPYILSCGHTYCYSCLCTWFLNNKIKKTCPDCRTSVTQVPAPVYVIREMALAFMARPDLLPNGETVEQHVKWQKEEANIVQRDKNNPDPTSGGLFRGSFPPRFGPSLKAIRDMEDGVDRCPICAWELEDSRCTQCGLLFDGDGAVAFGSGFSGFSDMDETSEHDPSSEDLDGEIDLEDQEVGFDYDIYLPDSMEGWHDHFDDDHSYPLRRWLGAGALSQAGQPYGQIPRRRAAHSAAGGRRRTYTASLVSDMYTEDTEMGVLAEEDEEDDHDDDASMRDFIDDGSTEERSLSTSSFATRTTPSPHNSRFRRSSQATGASESSVNSHRNTEEEDPEDSGPIPNGRRRHQAHTRSRAGRNYRGDQGSALSADSFHGSVDIGTDEDTEALLQEGYAPLGHGGGDDDMDQSEDDSDGGRTTVGWEPITISNDRSQARGSLTPTADRPNVSIRPPSRTGSLRFADGSRGLRRRRSVLSTASNANYEDGEADDDDSDLDHEAGVERPGSRAAEARLRNGSPSVRWPGAGVPNHSGYFQTSINGSAGIDGDTDDASDNSNLSARRDQRTRSRRQEYDPRISYLLAQHQTDVREMTIQQHDALLDHLEQLRATTPIARPRTANRNRGHVQANSSPAGPTFSPISNGSLPPFSPPLNAPSRLRTPAEERASSGSFSSGLSARADRAVTVNASSPPDNGNINGGVVIHRQSSSGPAPHSASLDSVSGNSNAPSFIQSGPAATSGLGLGYQSLDGIDRPTSRMSSRPPSAAGRRVPSQYSSPYHGISMAPGLNFAARSWQTQTRNPFVSLYVRPAQSNQRLREQSSTNTLRARNSQRALRQEPSVGEIEAGIQPSLRSPASRVSLRARASRQRLRTQGSVRTLRGTETQAVFPQGEIAVATEEARGRNPTIGLSEEERRRRANELIRRRTQELNNNPFMMNPARHGPPSRSNNSVPADVQGGGRPFAGSLNEGAQSFNGQGVNSSLQAYLTPAVPNTVPNLARRRSNRNIGPPAGAASLAPGSPGSRQRSGPALGMVSYDNSHGNMGGNRGMTSMTTTTDRYR